LTTDGPLKLYHFILLIAVVLALLSQMPSFHSLRYINLGSLLLSLGYTILLSAACIRAGMHYAHTSIVHVYVYVVFGGVSEQNQE
jgi:hypothetical protein